MARPRVADERRPLILAAFEACVVRRGLDATTLADVAAEAGQPRPLIRYFLGNREQMVAGLVERLLERGEAQLEAVRAAKTPATPADLAKLLFERIFADPTTNAVMMELWHLSLRDAAVRERLRAIYERIVGEIAAQVAPAARGRDAKQAFDSALAAVSLALGSALLKQMGVHANDPRRLLERTAASLDPRPATPGKESKR